MCGAPLRLDLAPVVADDAAVVPVDAPVPVDACPAGTRLRDGKCVVAPEQEPAQCDWKDPVGCAAACEADDAASCVLLGFAYENGVRRQIDPGKARAAVNFYKHACVDGAPAACSDLGAFYSTGSGVPRDFELAIGLYRRACSGANPRGCINLGLAYEAGDGVEKNPTKAAELFERGCTAEHRDGCSNLARLVHPKDPVRSLALLEESCKFSGMNACVDAGLRYDNGDQAPQDATYATALFARACEFNNPRGCANFGLQLLDGRGTKKDEVKAAGLFQRTCAEHRIGCDTLGELYAKGIGLEKDLTSARGILDDACAAGDERSCKMRRKLGL